MVNRAFYAALSFVDAAMLSTSCFAFDYAGDYRANGKDFRGGDYKGKAQITHIEGSIYNIFGLSGLGEE